ncbi:MAG: choice-of-anchor D domain-containing protein, partial [Nakamurella sp.]
RNPAAGQSDQRLATFVHAQLPAGSAGVTTPGAWTATVPNGAYTVTVAVGDAGVPVDSSNWINVENQNSIAGFVPTATSKFATATRQVYVADGRLTITPLSGTNTKIAYVDIDSINLGGRPYTTAVTPANLTTGVVPNASVTADNSLNAETGAVDETTLGNGHVKVTNVLTGQAVPGTGVTSGGGDTISFQASVEMDPLTLYRFEITDQAKDKSGRSFLPFSSVFTTSSGTGGGTANVAFDRTDAGAQLGKSYTSVVIGPDGKLYAGSIYGYIYRWTINADGSLANQETISTVRTHASANGWEGAPNRTIIGLTFDPASTAGNLMLWITDNYAYLGSDVPDATGAIAKLSGPNLENYQEVAVNLPRSIKDHETNSIAFHDGKLYITQGSMNAMGATDGTWKRAEHLLSAAVLELDPAKLPGTLPLDVATPDVNAPARGGVAAHAGTYNPYAAGAPLTLYATGIRNAFDLVWHSNGRLYTGTNGSAAGGATPASPATLPASCANRPDAPATSPSVPAIANNQQAETDYIFNVSKGKYYGHPNPMRCEYVLNAGNPTGYTGNPLFKVNAYPAGQLADPNYDLAGVNDAGLHASANGTIEYKNTTAFNGALTGKLIVVRYSANQEVVAFNVNGSGNLSTATTGITGFTGFKQPLDVAQDISNGNLYVTELTDNPATTGIKLLKPQGGGGSGRAEPTNRLVFTDVKGGAASAAQNVVVKNTGSAPLVISAAGISGADAALFARSGGPTLPATVAPGLSVTFPVTFAPTVAGPRGATLTFTTDSPVTPTAVTTLRGLGTDGLGGSNEPSLQWILDTLQIPVNVGDPDKTNNDMPASSTLLGEEVDIKSFTKAAFDHAVTVEPLSLFGPAGPTGNQNVVTVGVHSTANPTEKTPLFSGPNSANQTVLPAINVIGTGDYDLETPFGFDFTWHGLSNRVANSEDTLNTWDPTNPHKVRIYPLKNTDGSTEPNAYIVAPEDVLTPVDFQDAVIIVRNVKPAITSGAGKISTSPAELVFSAVKNTVTANQTVTVTNTGLSPLVISSVSVAGTNASSFTVTGSPQTLAIGGTATYTARFNPPSTSVTGQQSAVMRIVSDDASKPTLDLGLFGLATPGEQGNNEPALNDVVKTLGRNINVGGTGLILGTSTSPIGDEVLAPLFVKAGTGTVSIRPVARYSPDELLPFGWYTNPAGDPVLNEVASIALDQEQTLNPAIVAGGGNSFDPGSQSFGFYVHSNSFGRNTYTQDGLNTNIPKGVRTYPAKDRVGTVVANTYL